MKSKFKALLCISLAVLVTPIFADNTDTTAPATNAPAASQDMTAATATADDSTIMQNIKDKMAKEPSISSSNLTVDSKEGNVMLTGKVNNDEDAITAVQAAQSTQGVKDVDASKLEVQQSNRPLTDLATTGKVKGLLIREKVFGEKDPAAFTMQIETKAGAVYLTGTADDQTQVDKATQLAKSIPGVSNVDASNVQVQAKTNTDTTTPNTTNGASTSPSTTPDANSNSSKY